MKIAMALITRYSPLKGPKIPLFAAKKYVPTVAVLQWGRIQVTEGGDRMCCRELVKPGSLGRDCTYVRVRLFVGHASFHPILLIIISMRQPLIAMQEPRTNHRTWYLRRSLENFSGSSRSTYLRRRSSTSRNHRPCSLQLSSNATQQRAGKGFGSMSNSADLRRSTSDSFSVSLAGFLTEENGLSLTEAERVHMQTLRPASRSREGTARVNMYFLPRKLREVPKSVPSVPSVLSRTTTVPKLTPAPSVPSSVLGKSCARFSDKYRGHMMGHLPLVGATSHSVTPPVSATPWSPHLL